LPLAVRAIGRELPPGKGWRNRSPDRGADSQYEKDGSEIHVPLLFHSLNHDSKTAFGSDETHNIAVIAGENDRFWAAALLRRNPVGPMFPPSNREGTHAPAAAFAEKSWPWLFCTSPEYRSLVESE
jgi:hypothetical protein